MKQPEPKALVVEARVPGMIVRGTPAQFRRAAVEHPESEAQDVTWALEAMADALESFAWGD